MTEERIAEIQEFVDGETNVIDRTLVGELLEALREAQQDFEDMKHVAFGNQKYIDAEQRGYQRGIEAAIAYLEKNYKGAFSMKQGVRDLLYTPPPPVEEVK